MLKYSTRQYLNYTIYYFVPWEKAKRSIDAVLNKTYQEIKTFKESSRSIVHLIHLDDYRLILKTPVEKNRNRWIQLTTIIRKSEAFQSCISMLKLQEIGIETNKPLVAVEKKKMGMVVDSWYLSVFVNGCPCKEDHYKEIVETLQKIHQSGYLHGDAHLKNFLTGGNGIQVIDTSLSKAWSSVQKNMELVYLEKSVPVISQYFNTNSLSYKLAHFLLYHVQDKFRSIKKRWRQRWHL